MKEGFKSRPLAFQYYHSYEKNGSIMKNFSSYAMTKLKRDLIRLEKIWYQDFVHQVLCGKMRQSKKNRLSEQFISDSLLMI